MNFQNSWKNSAAALCAELGAEDGINPRLIKNHPSDKKRNRKDLQLCKEAQQALSLFLTGEAKMPILQELMIVSVEPDAGGKRLCITLGDYAIPPLNHEQVMNALNAVHGHLRTVLAQTLHRKYTPELSFRYIGYIGKE